MSAQSQDQGVFQAVGNERPLFVDLDGTLLATDSLWESIILLMKAKPWIFLILPFWLLKGKAFFKRQIAQRVVLNPSTLPYTKDVLSFLMQEKRRGRVIILATASDESIAQGVAKQVGLFSAVLASDGRRNLSGVRKLQAIQSYAGENGFDYIGNSSVDLPIWRAAQGVLMVGPSWFLKKKARHLSSVNRIFPRATRLAPALVKALRIHQWVKNALLFLPLILAHQLTNMEGLLQAAIAFLTFGLCASSVYILNDLLDLESDRGHPYKRYRPLASGRLSIQAGLLLVPLLLGGSFMIASLLLPFPFLGVVLLYFGLSTAYSIYLKGLLVVDVLVLAGFYSLRIFAGAVAVDTPVSPWLLVFSSFFFLNLALLKRYSELLMMQERQHSQAKGRSYFICDMELLRVFGPLSGYLSVLVFVLYANSSQVVTLYPHPHVLWLAGPLLLYWVTRMWLFAHRGKISDDPVLFSLKDPAGYVVGLGVVAVMLWAAM